MRQRFDRVGRGRVAVLLALALFVRALVPSGWMPVATPDGVRLALCPGQVAAAPPSMAGMHHGKAEHGGGKALPDAPCAFAGLGLAADVAPSPIVLAVSPPPAPAVSLLPLPVAVGRGLAAPPPPATGPPLFA